MWVVNRHLRVLHCILTNVNLPLWALKIKISCSKRVLHCDMSYSNSVHLSLWCLSHSWIILKWLQVLSFFYFPSSLSFWFSALIYELLQTNIYRITLYWWHLIHLVHTKVMCVCFLYLEILFLPQIALHLHCWGACLSPPAGLKRRRWEGVGGDIVNPLLWNLVYPANTVG